jgi:ATP-dependent protease ClpP protease subunit
MPGPRLQLLVNRNHSRPQARLGRLLLAMSCCRCPLLLLLLLLPLLSCSASSPTCAGSYGGRLVPHQTSPHACSASASCTWCVQHMSERHNRTAVGRRSAAQHTAPDLAPSTTTQQHARHAARSLAGCTAWQESDKPGSLLLSAAACVLQGMPIDSSVAELITAQLFVLVQEAPEPIYFYINSTGIAVSSSNSSSGRAPVLAVAVLAAAPHHVFGSQQESDINSFPLSRDTQHWSCDLACCAVLCCAVLCRPASQKSNSKYGNEHEAVAVYSMMRGVEKFCPIYTLCIGNAFGEAALLLAAGTKVGQLRQQHVCPRCTACALETLAARLHGCSSCTFTHKPSCCSFLCALPACLPFCPASLPQQGKRAALRSSTIMIRQPLQRLSGMQASDIDIYRRVTREKTHTMVRGVPVHCVAPCVAVVSSQPTCCGRPQGSWTWDGTRTEHGSNPFFFVSRRSHLHVTCGCVKYKTERKTCVLLPLSFCCPLRPSTLLPARARTRRQSCRTSAGPSTSHPLRQLTTASSTRWGLVGMGWAAIGGCGVGVCFGGALECCMYGRVWLEEVLCFLAWHYSLGRRSRHGTCCTTHRCQLCTGDPPVLLTTHRPACFPLPACLPLPGPLPAPYLGA